MGKLDEKLKKYVLAWFMGDVQAFALAMVAYMFCWFAVQQLLCNPANAFNLTPRAAYMIAASYYLAANLIMGFSRFARTRARGATSPAEMVYEFLAAQPIQIFLVLILTTSCCKSHPGQCL